MRERRSAVAISWNSSQGPTLGVEWEVQLIDAQTRLLRQDADQVLAGLTGLDASGEHRHIRHELMQSTVEIVTGICSTVSEARVDLEKNIAELRRSAKNHGIVLACSGTHPVSNWHDAKMAPIKRYAEIVEQMQWLAPGGHTLRVPRPVGVRDG